MIEKICMVLIFVGVAVGVGIYCRRHTGSVDGFILGGRNVGPWLSAFAFGTSYFSAVIFVGYAGQFGWKYGVAATWIGIGNAILGSLLAWWVLGPRTREMTHRLGASTMPEFFGARFQSKGLRIAAAAIIFVFLIPYTASVYNGLSRLFGIKNADERQNVSEEEIKYMVTDNDELLEDEKRMIHDILDLGDMTVHEIMTPRVDVMFAEDTDTVRQTVERMRGTGYSRLPVYHEDIDRIVGIVHFKDLVAPLMDGKEHEPVAEYAYEAMFVPETKDLFPLLAEMQTNRQQMAIVVDEYGGTDGLITVEDIVEEVVGEIVDETDRENPFIEQESENVWVVDGRFPVEDAAELGWPVEDSADYETIAGWLMSMLDSVPQVGEELAFDGYRFKIQAMRRRRISTVRVERLDDPSPSCVDAVEAIDREEA